ncbi:MAG: glycosyltransferase [Myxococcales bacterium]|nr:glycosyltransferase [Myxococcales bacterium]
MRVLVTVPSFPETRGDACSPALAETIVALGESHDVEVVSLFLPQPQRTYQIDNVRVFSLGAHETAPSVRWAAPVASAVAAAARANRRKRVDVVLGFGIADTGLATVAASRVLRVPCIVYLGSSELITREDIGYGLARFGLRRALMRTVLRGAEHVLVASPVHAALAMVVGNVAPERVHLAPLGIRADRFLPNTIENNKPGTSGIPPIIVSVSPFAPNKAPETLLTAFARLSDIPCRLQLIGGGKYESLVRHKAIRLGIESRVEFTGTLRHDEIPERLKQAAVYVQAADWEPEGAALLEAMAVGIPVVSTPTGLAPEAIAHAGCGMLVPHGDDEAMASAIRATLGQIDVKQRAATEGSSKIRERFSATNAARVLAQTLRFAITNR